ncbi:TetR/AcrR family transcriptional regulator [Algoriphagus sp. D3-2-R+10]|uniref:TetR/AcrR family transcriptional regulator n=1 Tax=Algoriphagus aurantiacus TaxID=3103948 RepID=UPI002B3BD609|nr:TetR/AcrR family transcriptional regulator [Algoriphagus sp. D3-2-R+10]MEB2776361.1 TetR/AcrR family transcriptional regulator [Algoriphagus sp. D3-2-R+10]
MSKKASVESKILDAAYKLFLQKGYRHTTMDDIAQILGMSKKTLYKYYPGKLELLAASFEVTKTKLTAKVEAVLENRYISFPLKLKSTLTVMASLLGPINPELFEDLREYAPEIWVDLEQYIKESAYTRFKKLLEQGISEGLVKPSVNINLVVMLYATAVQSLMDPKFTRQFPEPIQKGMKISPADIYDQAITIIYNGILTEDARNEFANG